jgi:DNA mismatch repair protein MutL
MSRAVEGALSEFPRQGGIGDMAWPFAPLPVSGPTGLREDRPDYGAVGTARPLAQLHHSYILAQTADALLIVDQHAAHEAILFERLSQPSEERVQIDPPVTLDLTLQEANLLTDHAFLFAELGFEIDFFGGNTFLVRGAPAILAGRDPAELIPILLEEIGRFKGRDRVTLQEKLASKASCTAAVTAGDILTLEEMGALLDELLVAWSPATCPHGRPVLIRLSLEELERRLMRR